MNEMAVSNTTLRFPCAEGSKRTDQNSRAPGVLAHLKLCSSLLHIFFFHIYNHLFAVWKYKTTQEMEDKLLVRNFESTFNISQCVW